MAHFANKYVKKEKENNIIITLAIYHGVSRTSDYGGLFMEQYTSIKQSTTG